MNRGAAKRPSVKWITVGLLIFGAWILAMYVQTVVHHGAAELPTTKTSQQQVNLTNQTSVVASSATCQMEEHAEYHGTIMLDGYKNFQPTAGDCCESCRAKKGCNVWVWCGKKSGCPGQNGFGHCALKEQEKLDLMHIEATRRRGISWTSGTSHSAEDLQQLYKQEENRLEALRNDESLPLVWMDVSVKGEKIGRIEFVLFTKEAPLAAENFRALCTGEKGVVPKGHEGAGRKYHFKGSYFYRIIDGFIDQAGANTDSVFGGQFKDDPAALKLKHDRKGLLSMANTGHDTNDSHFSIMIGPQPHLNGKHPVFGEVVRGWEVVEAVNKLSVGKKESTAGKEVKAIISDSGQIRCGNPCGNPALYKQKSSNR